MSGRWEARPQSDAGLPLEGLATLIRAWRRHWDEVGTIQQSLPLAARQRVEHLSSDLDTALAQTRHLFALEFAPEAVAALRADLDDALRMVDTMAGGRVDDPDLAMRHLAATQFALNVRAVIDAGERLEMHLQPIVELNKPLATPTGYEALARFQTSPYEPPTVWLERAASAGMQHELELSCVRAALAHLPSLPDTAYLAINVSPETLVSAEFARLIAEVDAHRVVVEVTEHQVVREYDMLLTAIGDLRRQGVRLAVDDAGAGFASFRHVVELCPEIIKLDIHLIRRISTDHNRAALVRSLVSFAADVGATLVAEGIETQDDLLTLRDAQVPLGQGNLFAHPGPPPEILPTGRRSRSAAESRHACVTA
jgi:EAL domain-containing protein (putative c-di-GMP-specific phosphodiesterase class I)